MQGSDVTDATRCAFAPGVRQCVVVYIRDVERRRIPCNYRARKSHPTGVVACATFSSRDVAEEGDPFRYLIG